MSAIIKSSDIPDDMKFRKQKQLNIQNEIISLLKDQSFLKDERTRIVQEQRLISKKIYGISRKINELLKEV